MAPRRPTAKEQQDEFKQTLETFTISLHDALQHAVENTLTTVLQNQHDLFYGGRERRQIAADYDKEDAGVFDNIFANPDREH